MRIGINARLYSESGIGRYIRNLLKYLQKLDRENDYFIFLLRKDFEDINFPKNFTKVLADFSWYGMEEQYKFPGLLNKYKLDLVHIPHFNVPIFYLGKMVVTVHDLIHQNFSMNRATTLDPFTYKVKQFGYSTIFNLALRNSKKIIVPSNYVKSEILKKFSVYKDKIVVTYEGVDEEILKIKNQISNREIEKTMKHLNIKPPYIFYVGNAHPHKNVEGLIKAFLRIQNLEFRVQNGYKLKLVLSGSDHYFWQRLKKENMHNDIIYTGYVTDEQLVALYMGAKAFVMPSFEEGFGIPLLEAMALGTPVVSSDAASLKEIGGDGAIYFDPNNLVEMESKIKEVLNNEKLRKELVEKGRERVKEFSWEKLAKETLEIYQQKAEHHG